MKKRLLWCVIAFIACALPASTAGAFSIEPERSEIGAGESSDHPAREFRGSWALGGLLEPVVGQLVGREPSALRSGFWGLVGHGPREGGFGLVPLPRESAETSIMLIDGRVSLVALVPGPGTSKPVPEPSAALAFALGTVVLGAALRGRRHRH